MAIVKLVFAFVLSVSQILTPYFQFAFKGGIDSFFEDWSENQQFTQDYAVTLKKTPGKDFIIMNLTDVQLNDSIVFGEDGEKTDALIKKCVEEIKPDLITLTGDNASGKMTYLHMIELLESFGIPYAPVMGNHDGDNGNRISEAWDSYHLSNAEHCLFKFGPKGMGYGNYIINITENDKIIHTLFMMDTHSNSSLTENGKINEADGIQYYDHFWADQLKWYKWGVNGIKSVAGKTVESTVFMHIPCYEYRTALFSMCDITLNYKGELTKAVVKDEYKDGSFGSLNENVCAPVGNNGFFALAKELGSTTRMIAGHDHTNNLSLKYDGINLDYALKSGYGSYFSEDKLGASVITVKSDGTTQLNHYYCK